MKKIIVFLSFITVLTNCKNNNTDEFVNAFNHTQIIKLSSQPVILKKTEVFFSHMFEMKYVGGLILVGDASEFYTMKIIDLKQKTVKNFGKRGRGPNEINSQACRYSIDNKNNRLFVTDGFNYYFYSIDSLKAGKYNPDIKLSPNFKGDNFFGSTTFCNGFIVGGMFEKKFGIYNIEKRTLLKKNDYPNSGGAFLSQSNFYNHPTKNLVCSFQSKSAVMNILKIVKNDLKIKEFSWWTSEGTVSHEGNKISFDPKKGNRNGFIATDVTNKYIYTLYSGKIIDASSMDKLAKAFISKNVYVFDWEGKPIKRYELDQEVRSIAVDEKNNILYAASYIDGDPNLIQYALK